MAVHKYMVGSEEGAVWAASQKGHPVEAGEEHEFDLSVDQKRALLAAGWLEEAETKKEKK